MHPELNVQENHIMKKDFVAQISSLNYTLQWLQHNA